MKSRAPSVVPAQVWLFCSLPLLMLVIASCAGDGQRAGCANPVQTPAAPQQQNLFLNPSFEQGRDPWISLETAAWGRPFSATDRAAHSGSNSALLELRSDEEEAGSVRVYGVVYEMKPEEFPELISGYYCVERWDQGTPRQYLQFVVIALAAENIPEEVASSTNHQMRYILAGVDSQPTFISNARYVMIARGQPKLGEWVRFERNVRDDFEALWSDVPKGYAGLRVFFEVRWDDRQPSDGVSAADVYYDDLYFGPAESDRG